MRYRKAKNQLEIDLLPPFGQPEVDIVGEGALIGGLLICGAVALNILNNK